MICEQKTRSIAEDQTPADMKGIILNINLFYNDVFCHVRSYLHFLLISNLYLQRYTQNVIYVCEGVSHDDGQDLQGGQADLQKRFRSL